MNILANREQQIKVQAYLMEEECQLHPTLGGGVSCFSLTWGISEYGMPKGWISPEAARDVDSINKIYRAT